ncbi:MAG: ribonuclease H-like domain-containing protein [Xanthomonadaceae bacterium]|jgi:hypothetical protein|nr:ribonuclease H-like domain-containing protein [Xanthomonadaceae bacterium]
MADPRSGADLQARLGALLRQRGSVVASPPSAGTTAPTPAAGVADRVADAVPADDWTARIEFLRQAQRVREARRRTAERALPGTEVAPGVRCIEFRAPLPPCARDPVPWEAGEGAAGPLVYLDTETTGLAGGTGTLVFLLGLAWHDGDALAVQQWLLVSPGAEERIYRAMMDRLPENPHLVSFNGKAFDLPLLAARLRLSRLRDPLAGRAHWDLLHPLRRAFDSRWPDCRLQTAERRLLGIERVDDLPGAFAPQAYTAFLRQGETAMLGEAIRHNRDDVVALARLLPALRAVYADPSRFDADAAAIGRRLAQAGRPDAARAALEGALHDAAARRALASIHARERRWPAVEALLAPLAEGPRPCALALERLAKIAEHVHRDRDRARRYAERLVAIAPTDPRHRRRLQRLSRSSA